VDETTSETIVGADVRLVRVPVDPPRGDAIQKFSTLELPLITVSDRAGRAGVGFGYTIGTGGHAITTLMRETLVPLIIGEDARRIAAVHARLLAAIHALTPGCVSSAAIAAIDVALWDLAGHRTNTPLHVLLGGARDRVPVYDTDVGWLDRPLDEMLEESRRALKHGFRALKLKVGKPEPEEDRERVARVRETVGAGISLMIDANQSWTADEAGRRLRKLEPYDLVWIEEPLPATDLAGFERLGALTSIPRAGGESLYAPAHFWECAHRRALDILQPDVVRVGGITPCLEVCHLAAAAGLPVAPHVSPELSVTVAAAVPNSIFVEYVPQMEPVLAEHVRIEDGCALAPATPGHGIRFDPAALARYEARPGVA
jgi:L-alanine-DL-glutamate epimerase-like enolase superfamily enzyme